MKFAFILIVLICYHLFASTFGLILIKLFFNQNDIKGISWKSLNILLDWRLIAGILCYFTSAATWFYILASYKLVFIYPILSGLSYVMVVISSIFFIKEKPDYFTIIGIVLILAGIITITLKGRVE